MGVVLNQTVTTHRFRSPMVLNEAVIPVLNQER
jgi:hypothetical protein